MRPPISDQHSAEAEAQAGAAGVGAGSEEGFEDFFQIDAWYADRRCRLRDGHRAHLVFVLASEGVSAECKCARPAHGV